MPAMPSDTDFTSNCSWAITEDMTESQIKALQVRAKTALEDGQVKAGHIRSACKLLKWTPKNITRTIGPNPYMATQGDNNAVRARTLAKLTQGDVELKYLTHELETFMTAPWLGISGQPLTEAQQTVAQARRFYQTRQTRKEAQHAQSLYAATPKICETPTSHTPSPASGGSKSSTRRSQVTPQRDPHLAKSGTPKFPTNAQGRDQTRNPHATRDQRLATMAPGFFLPGTTLLSSSGSGS